MLVKRQNQYFDKCSRFYIKIAVITFYNM